MSSPQTLSARVAEFVSATTFDDVPDAVLHEARNHVLDALGSALGSSAMNFGDAVHTAARRLGAGQEAHAIGYGTALPAASAALVNGTLIHGFDFDDTHVGAVYHATAPALAGALAAAEEAGATGRRLLLGYVLGMEIGCRIAAAGAGRFHARGFHPTGIAGTFAAACAAASIRGAGPETARDALGLCGSQAGGLLEIRNSWLKRVHPGWAAHSGLIALTLAESGFSGPATVFEGTKGLFATHLGFVPDGEGLGLDTLGERWMTAETAYKPYPCCHFTHAFADAAFQVLDELGARSLRASDITRIVCPTSPGVMPEVTEPAAVKIAPATTYDAMFSVQYAVASVLVRGRLDLATFYDDPLDDPEVLAVARLVECPADPDSDYPARFPGEVRLHLGDGREITHRVTASRGTPGNRFTDEDVTAKFLGNATRRIPRDQAEAVARTVRELGVESDVDALVASLVAEGRR
ncbi:MmgE/PrpD family protein [Saccharopolyspora sp. NFXS83]|uniref:MmgE/PrpD family protein n=1 Tax=Saccharopolyspora sp. NFXS83 TaxID=2993560 RepID=UPI00224B6ECC|nr:MmgE/PrpD family protein [Saccharopolyspora sp. NFXS83]MCX2730679.1 MmgE/PrpD family protein [Saccharopolyspora sp. NFXS83]